MDDYAVNKLHRIRARLREKPGEDYVTPLPGVDIFRGYDFPITTAEQLRVLDRRALCRATPALTLEEFLSSRHADHSPGNSD